MACLKKHKDWKKIIPLLYPAIEGQIRRRRNKLCEIPQPFVPPWKHFKTWLNNNCWEETEGTEVDPEEEAKKEKLNIERKKQKGREQYGRYFEEKPTGILEGYLKSNEGLLKFYHWLIKEILEERLQDTKEANE